MIKEKSKTKMLFKSNKPEMQISLNTLYGSRYLLFLTNFALICIAVILCVISASIFLMPVSDISRLPVKADIQEAVDVPPYVESSGNNPSEDKAHDEVYTVIADRNIFSPQRKEWVVKAVIPKPAESAENKKARRNVLAEKPKKIVLQGIVIAGELRKALINNPLTGVSKNKTQYVEEGDEVDGYRVTSIESDQIRLDWHGEEIIVTLYSGLVDSIQADNTDNVNEGSASKAEYKYKKIEDRHAEVDIDKVDEKTDDSFAEVSDEMPISLMSMEPEESERQ